MRQSHESPRLFRSKAMAGLAFGTGLAVLLSLAAVLSSDRNSWGDEGTFIAMTASLARDGDLIFGDTDRQHLLQHPDDPAPTVILQETGRGITYSKPLLYPLISAPLFAILGESGLVVTNALALALALGLAWMYLRRLATARRAFWTVCTFVGASVVVVYLGWKMSDMALLSLTLMGLVLALGGRRLLIDGVDVRLPFDGPGAAILGGLVLGAAVTMRFTTAALAAATVVALLLDRRWRRGLVVGALILTGFLAISGVTVLLLGTANPYKAARSSFNQSTGYPAGETLEQASERFTTRPATQSATWRPPLDLRRTAYSSLYFIFGRHTGVLFYFPAALALLLPILRRPDRVSLPLLLGVIIVLGFYLVWMPENYFGGSTFVGNRYFLGVFPVLLVAATRLPSSRQLAIAWAVALVAWGSAFYSVRTVRHLDRSSQAHAHAGLFRRLPFESTAQRIDGLAERFWADDFIRFLDPFAAVAPASFRLDSSHPATELLVAADRHDSPLYFVISPSAANVDIVARDWHGQSDYSLPLPPPDPPGVLAVPTSAAWRRHSYWWKPNKIYSSKVIRFSLINAGQDGASAVVRYAGRGREIAPLGAEILGVMPPLPEIEAAGSQTVHTLRVRNTGRRPWKRGGLFPVELGFRFVTGSQGHAVTSGSSPLPKNVTPGEVLVMPLTLQWPDEPGTYQLTLDILREPTGALKHLGRLPVRVETVRVEPEASPGTPAP